MLQRQFGDRYEAMKSHYEQRIVQLSEVIQDTCMTLCSDELLASMKQDATSSAFMPAHISEILNVHIDAERERYLHDLVQHASTLEAQNRALQDKAERQHVKITRLEAENHAGRRALTQVELLTEQSRLLDQQLAQLSDSRALEAEQLRGRVASVERERDMMESKSAHAERALEERTSNSERLRRQNESQATEIRQLESTVEQLARDLAVIESVDAQEQQLKAELKEQLRQLGGERELLMSELGDVRAQLRYAEAEVARLEAVERDKDAALSDARSKQTQLMTQVEAMLQLEAEESNAAIASVHEKMKELRHKLFTELTKEKRHSAAVAEELAALREFKDEKTRELRNAVEDEVMLREKLQREVRKTADLGKLLAEEAAQTQDARMRRHEAEVAARYAQDTAVMLEKKVAEAELRHKEELLAAEEAARFRAEKTHDHSVADLRSEAFRLHYQNQMHESHAALGVNPLRHSYSGPPSVPQDAHMAGGANNVAHLEAALRAAKDTWAKERAQLEQSATQYIMRTEKLQSELDMVQRKVQLDAQTQEEAQGEAEKTRARETAATAAQHSHDQALLRSRLDEAGRHIEKLKNMVIEKKHQVDWLQMEAGRLQQALSDEVDQEKQTRRDGRLDHLTEETKIKELQQQLDAMQAALVADKESYGTQHAQLEKARDEAAQAKLQAAELQAHAQSLQEQLQYTQKVALEEQAADGAMLMDMKGKFDALMRQYEGSKAASKGADAAGISANGDKDHEIARLRAQLAQAATAVAANAPSRTQDDASQGSNASNASSAASGTSRAAKALAHRDAKLAEARKDVAALEAQLGTYRQKMSEMAAQLGESRRKSPSRKASNGDEALQQLAQLREELQRRDVEAERATHLHERQLVELRQAHNTALHAAKQSGPALNAFTPERVSKASKFSPGAEAAAAAGTTDWGKTGGRARASAYETAAKALLDALIRAQMIDAALALDINRLAAGAEQSGVSSASVGQAVQSKLDAALERYKAEYQAALSITINESETLQLRVADLQAQLRHSHVGATQGAGRGLNSSHYDEALSVDADSSRGGVSALAELEQSRHEHALLVELTKLEGDARTKMLLAQMKDLQKKHTVEVDRQQAEKREELQVQRGMSETRLAGLQEEMRSLKQTIAFQADSLSDASQTRSFTMDTKLQLEKNRRKELIAQFEQVEEQHRVTIEELESANLVLEQRCERAELQVTRLKMELLATGGGSGTARAADATATSPSRGRSRDEEKSDKDKTPKKDIAQSLPHYMTSLSAGADAVGEGKGAAEGRGRGGKR